MNIVTAMVCVLKTWMEDTIPDIEDIEKDYQVLEKVLIPPVSFF